MNNTCKIAITGGPSGGKTTLIEMLRREFGQKCTIIPEAASMLYLGGFPRIKTDVAVEHAQKAIYATQKELESLLQRSYPENLIICDRGSLDSVAYWPKSVEQDFFTALNTTVEKELKRYDWVIHLDTASEAYYDTSNPIRTETFSEAYALNEKTKAAWKNHPRLITVPHNVDFLSKMSTALTIVKAIYANKSIDSIRKEVQQ